VNTYEVMRLGGMSQAEVCNRRDRRVREMHSEGWKPAEIALEMEISERVVHRAIAGRDRVEKRGRKLDEAKRAEITRRRAAGERVHAIAAAMGISRKTVWLLSTTHTPRRRRASDAVNMEAP
jgi:DNA-binding NarL/FixJ family response regulator